MTQTTDHPGTKAEARHSTQSDPLVQALVHLCRVQGVSTSVAQLTDGLPRPDKAMMTADLAPLALRRANMSCRITRESLDTLPEHSFPVLLFLKDQRCVILESLSATEAQILLPEAGGGRANWSRDDLNALHDGRSLISKPLDIVSKRLDEKKSDRHHWILGPVLKNWWIYRDVMLASFAANLLAIATALFSMQVYDRVVPNNAFEHTLDSCQRCWHRHCAGTGAAADAGIAGGCVGPGS